MYSLMKQQRSFMCVLFNIRHHIYIYFSEQGLCSLDVVQVIPIKPIYHWEVSTRSQKLTLKSHEYIARHVRGRKVPLE